MQLIQVILTAGPTPVITKAIAPGNSRAFSWITIQKNTGDPVRVGDSTVSATRGIVLSPAATAGATGAALTICPALQYTGDLTDMYLFGTAGDVVDILIFE